MVVPREHGHRTGWVRKIDIDQGVVEGLGAVIDPAKKQYYLSLQDPMCRGIFVKPPTGDAPVEIKKALVVFKESEPTHTEWDIPSLLVNCDDISPAQSRIAGVVEQYRLPAEGAAKVAVGPNVGWSHYATREQEQPYDFTYTIECWSRYRTVAQMLLQLVMVRYPIYGKVRVVDTLGVERIYHTFQEGTADLTEVASLVDRVVGYSLTIRVEAELSLDRVEKVLPAFVGQTVPGGSGVPGGGGGMVPGGGAGSGVDPGPGSLIGDGLPAKRVTVIGSDE